MAQPNRQISDAALREIAWLEKRLSDLEIGWSNLKEQRDRGNDVTRRMEYHAIKMARVENRLFELRQGRLF